MQTRDRLLRRRTTFVTLAPAPGGSFAVVVVGEPGEVARAVEARARSLVLDPARAAWLLTLTKSECIRYYCSAWNAFVLSHLDAPTGSEPAGVSAPEMRP